MFILIIFSLFSCQSPTAFPVNNGSITLSFYEAASTEAWLKLNASNVTFPVNLTIKSDNNILFRSSISSSDSLIYIDSLLPNKTYSIEGYYTINNIQHTTNNITLTTMDTTSNNFTWQTFTFGGHAGSCNLYDVTIINDTSAYAVGSIYLNDSSGKPDPYVYNSARWNGSNWNLIRIYFINSQNQKFLAPYKSVVAININDIFFATDQISKWNGTNFESIEIPNNVFHTWINKIYGTTKNSLYIIGDSGSIASYQNGSWQKIESGTTADINDIWGINIDGSAKVYCAVSDVFQLSEHKILTIDETNKVDSVKWDTGRRVGTIWTKNGFPIYAGGGGVFENKRGYWKEQTEIPLYYSERIRGNDLNDIYVCGDFGLFAHYNGVRWTVFKNLSIYGAYLSVAVKNNLVIAVGYLNNEQAIIVVGKRY